MLARIKRMPASILTPKQCSPQDLDAYLAKGWRPLGQQIYVADFIQIEAGEIYSVIPTRLALTTHQWTKRQRKLLRRNQDRFTYHIRPAKLDPAKREVNRQYLAQHPDKSTPDLSIHLHYQGKVSFNTYECAIFDGEELVAFSFFDLGAKSAYSKAGIYNPAYAKYSLGNYTMYLEMQWLQRAEFTWYYPGYVSPDIPLFDYKLQLGEMEFWSMQSKEWLPIRMFQQATYGPLTILLQQLQQLNIQLAQHQFQPRIFTYAFFEMPMMRHPNQSPLLSAPYLVLIDLPLVSGLVVVTYNLELNQFRCWQCERHRS
ncbi:MAG: hypothetical protein AAGJ82_06060, partial [Bacteroidota bacterium]